MANEYEDIIHLPHPTSEKRARMSVYNRAAQFSPFAALTGYEDAVRETARFTAEEAHLDEYQIAIINDKLNTVMEKKDLSSVVSITYFKPDERKKGGEYLTVLGVIRRIDQVSRCVQLQDGLQIPIKHIYDIDGEIFERGGN